MPDSAVMQGADASTLGERIRRAVGSVWLEVVSKNACTQGSPVSPYGAPAVAVAEIPFRQASDAAPVAHVAAYRHQNVTSEAAAAAYARAGGPTQITPAAGEATPPGFEFNNRLLDDVEPAPGRHIWIYETLQCVFGVAWTDHGMVYDVLVPKSGDTQPHALAEQTMQVLTALAT
jgi:hypothetical protein